WGREGPLPPFQVGERVAGVEPDRELIVRDYLPQGGKRQRSSAVVLADLDGLSANDLLDVATVARALGFAGGADGLDAAVSPRGYRLLAKVPRLPGTVIERLFDNFSKTQK